MLKLNRRLNTTNAPVAQWQSNAFVKRRLSVQIGSGA